MVREKSFKVVTALILVVAVTTSLWFAAPVKALTIDISDPSPTTLGSTVSFNVIVSIEDSELLPIKSVDLKIYNVANPATYYDQYTDLSLEDEAYVTYTTSGTGADASIMADADPTWGYFTTGAGSVVWRDYGYTFSPIVGGYGYQTGTGTTSITYSINWTPLSGWPGGGYKVDAKITAQDDQTFTETSTAFTLSTPSVGGGGGGGGGGASGVTSVYDIITPQGRLTQAVTAESDDGEVELFMAKNTIALTEKGHPLRRIIMRAMAEPPEPPADARIIALAYDFSPDGVTFNPPATLTFTYDPARIPDGATADSLVIAWWDEESGEWVNLVSTVHPETNPPTITAEISGFTVFSVIGYTRPAAFAASDLAISPIEVTAGATVTISAVVTNTGDLAGDYQVILKINDEVVATSVIALDGGASQKVIFTSIKDETGAYTVNIDGQTGTFVVKAPPAIPVPPKPAEFVTSGLIIAPTMVDAGESVTISVLITNTGDLAGTYEVTLKLDNVAVATKNVSLDGGASQMATFTTSKDAAGTYTIDIGGLSGTFTVRAAPPPIPTINWWLIGSLIAAAMIIGIIASLLYLRRRALLIE